MTINFQRLIFSTALLLCCKASFAQKQTNPDSLLKHKQFFILRDVLNTPGKSLSAFEHAYFTAFVDNFFNRSLQSNKGIEILLNKYANRLPVKKQIALLKVQEDNDVKLFDYTAAFKHTQQLLNDYDTQLTKEDKDDAQNSIIIWKNLINVHKQNTIIKKDIRVNTARDIAGLLTIPVTFGDYQDAYVFDTGANISVITESNAKKAQLQMVGDTFRVDAITGIKIKARTGICPEFKIGDLIVRNAVFMVFPDSALSFAGGKYTIKGIIGFPVIASMKEVRINKVGYLEIPAKISDMAIHNFGLDGLTPVVNLEFKGTMLPFTFDTGAQETHLNKAFYDLFRADVELQGTSGEVKLGGAGGANTTKSYKLPSLSFKLYDKAISLTNVHVKTTIASENDNFYFGNLGQDAFAGFDELLINFNNMYVIPTNKKE
jgi:hypothetical protein